MRSRAFSFGRYPRDTASPLVARRIEERNGKAEPTSKWVTVDPAPRPQLQWGPDMEPAVENLRSVPHADLRFGADVEGRFARITPNLPSVLVSALADLR